MIFVTNTEAVTFSAGHDALEEVELDNTRGMTAAELNAVVATKVQAFRMRMKALGKERAKIIKDHAQTDRKGNLQYANPNEPDANKRILLWIDGEKATRALEAWQEKADEIAELMVQIDAEPLRDDFFTKPTELDVKQSIRAAFLPFLAKYQAPRQAAHPAAKKRRR